MAKCWSYQVNDSNTEQIVADESRIYLGSGGAKVEAISVEGKKVWSSEFGGEVQSNILAADGTLFLVTSTVSSESDKQGDGKLRSISKETGITNWTIVLADSEKYFLNNFHGAVIVVSKSGTIQSIEAKSGNLQWKREIAAGFVTEPLFTMTDVIVASTGKQIFRLSMASGEISSVRKAAFGITALASTQNRSLIVADERGNIVELNGGDKPGWSFKAGGEISNVLSVGENILAASHDNYVYFLRSRNGSRRWKARLTGRVSSLTVYDNSHALLSGFDGHRVIVVELRNGKIAGQGVFDDDEIAVQTRADAGLPILILTNKALHAYSFDGCALK